MVTSLYLGILGLVYFWISIETIMARGKNKVSLGAGENNEIIHLVSAHGNFSSYVPFFLLALYLLEQQTVSAYAIHALAVVFVFGRLLHFLTMRNKEQTFKYRKTGMMLTLWPLIIVSLWNIYCFV
jgi:uncharacterized membrane protein YecN with MAPEG domain